MLTPPGEVRPHADEGRCGLGEIVFWVSFPTPPKTLQGEALPEEPKTLFFLSLLEGSILGSTWRSCAVSRQEPRACKTP